MAKWECQSCGSTKEVSNGECKKCGPVQTKPVDTDALKEAGVNVSPTGPQEENLDE